MVTKWPMEPQTSSFAWSWRLPSPYRLSFPLPSPQRQITDTSCSTMGWKPAPTCKTLRGPFTAGIEFDGLGVGILAL